MVKIMSGYDAYVAFLAVRSHFTSNYDYFKYHGKMRVSPETYEKAKGKFFYQKLAKRYKDEFPEFVATQFAYGHPVKWVGDCEEEECVENWNIHQKHIQSMRRTFELDMRNIVDCMREKKYTVKQVFKAQDDDLPLIEKMRRRNLTSIETCIILDRLTDYVSKNKCDNPLWDDAKVMLKKYSPFIHVELKDYANIFEKKLLN